MDERPSGNGSSAPGRLSTPVPPGRGIVPPSPPDRYRYSMAELEEQTGFPARTIRYYVTKALLPPAHGRGPTATYDLGHLLRLRAIQRRRSEGVSLDEIKVELGDLSDQQIAALLDVRTDPIEDRWRRIILHDDIELHVRERAGRAPSPEFERSVGEIIGHARAIVDKLDRFR